MPSLPPDERLENLFYWTDVSEYVYPFYFIDPTADDASDQVHRAVDRGVYGFKAACSGYAPGDERAMKTYRTIAGTGKPILFHSGILFDDTPSANYNRPGNFEVLMEVKGLRFALAHISWPWCDECLAVYGKFESAMQRGADVSVEMFIDVTPGTPPIYRRDALTKLFTIDCDLKGNVFFGTDGKVNDYNSRYAAEWIERDAAVYDELQLDEETVRKVFSENLLRFLGIA
jgi:predicted TIM-barrel fold metal-dependent hydrolase